MLMAALAHEVADSLVHGDTSGGHKTWHAGDDAMVARRNHARTCAQNRHELEHVVDVRCEHRRAWDLCGDIAASNSVQPLHADQNRKNAMALQEGLRCVGKPGNVVAVFAVHFWPGFKKIDGAVLAVFVDAGRDPCKIFRDGSFHGPHERMDWRIPSMWPASPP